MSFLTNFLNMFFADIWTPFASLLCGYLAIYLVNFYRKIFTLPPGPIPLPIIGNLLELRTKGHWKEALKKCGKRYGPVFTFWMGNNPSVIICDIDIAREVFAKKEFSGRVQTFIASYLSNENGRDVLMNDYGKTYKILRKITHTAAQKFATNDNRIYSVIECVDKTVEVIIREEGVNKEFCPKDYINRVFLNMMTIATFGENNLLEDETIKLQQAYIKFIDQFSSTRIFVWDFSPIIRLLDYKDTKKFKDNFNQVKHYSLKFYQDHLRDFDESVQRDDFCDALISAKNEAHRASKKSAQYLTDANLAACIVDLFAAGTATSQVLFQWFVLHLAYYPEIQQKLRQEIESQIGDRIPTHEDRNQCHYVMAFMSEIMRYRNTVSSGVPHKAVVTSKIGEYTIPEGTPILVLQDMILTDEKYWPNANQFIPERFLEEGKYMTTRHKAFIPFGLGRRICLGENLAIADLFLVLVRFLQKTSDYDIVLGGKATLEPDPQHVIELAPKDYKILLKTKSVSK